MSSPTRRIVLWCQREPIRTGEAVVVGEHFHSLSPEPCLNLLNHGRVELPLIWQATTPGYHVGTPVLQIRELAETRSNSFNSVAEQTLSDLIYWCLQWQYSCQSSLAFSPIWVEKNELGEVYVPGLRQQPRASKALPKQTLQPDRDLLGCSHAMSLFPVRAPPSDVLVLGFPERNITLNQMGVVARSCLCHDWSKQTKVV